MTPFARALIEEWQYRFGLALYLLSEGCSYSYSNLLDSFYLPISIFGSRGYQVSIQMVWIVFNPRDNSYMGKLLDDLSKRSRVHAVFPQE